MQSMMEKYFNEIVASTVEILKFDSSLKEAEENGPFGKEARGDRPLDLGCRY